ncbi:MAG TPA: hypothetical protein VFQ51_11485 [Vicinamibacteria bacterium]|nr:hypothetical protein [Vicinamibacteria bacterium]
MTSQDGSRTRPWRDYALALALVLATSALVHGPRFAGNMHRHHWEDWRFFRHARQHLNSPLDCFTHEGPWPGLYRPISTNLYYLCARWAFGTNIEAYHVVNAVLFTANALLLFAIARLLLPFPWPFLPPVLFVSRIAHYQVLLYTSEIQALLSTLFALACISWFLSASLRPSRTRDALALIALLLGLLSKESVVIVPAVLTAHGLVVERPWRWRRYAALWALTAAWLAAYVVVRHRVGGGAPTGYAYDLSWSIVGRYAAYELSFLNVLVAPIDSAEMASRVMALSGHAWLSVLLALVSVAAVAAGVRAARREGSSRVATSAAVLGLAWFAFGMMPFVCFADRLFGRYTYFGHAGLALVVAGMARLLADAVRQRGMALRDAH